MASKTQRVGYGVVYISLNSLVGRIIQVTVGVGGGIVHGGRHKPFMYCQYSSYRLYTSGRPQKVTGNRFCRAYGKLVSMLSEHLLYCLGFKLVVVLGGSSVGRSEERRVGKGW